MWIRAPWSRLRRAKGYTAAAAFALLFGLPGAMLAASPVKADDSIVRAVLFYSPTCPHCHLVMTESLPPLQSKYGSRLQILTVDVTTPVGGGLYEAAVAQFNVPEERTGVPTLVVSSTVLVGSAEIPEELPSLVGRLLASGGSDWPAIPGLADVLTPEQANGPSVPASSALPAGSLVFDTIDRLARDPFGSALAIGVLLGLLGSLAWAASVIWRARTTAAAGSPSALVPVIALAGLAVAAYLAIVETTGAAAVCGPVGDCNRVHQSEFARLFGLLPIGVLGCAGYASILTSWFVGRVSSGRPAHSARLGLVGLAFAGALFSLYLTFLEPFVIGATCGWCLASAVLMGGLLLVATSSMWRVAWFSADREAAFE